MSEGQSISVLAIEETVSGQRSKSPRRRPGQVVVDLQDSKEAWLLWCRSMGLTPSEALRGITSRLQPGHWPGISEPSALAPSKSFEPRAAAARPKVPLTDEDSRSVQALSAEEGMSVPRWILALIRAHIAASVPVGTRTEDVLRESNLEVQAVGRSLNQIARALNAIVEHLDQGRLAEAGEGLRATSPGDVRELIRSIKSTIDAHLPIVSTVLTDNAVRWRRSVRRGKARP